MFQVGPSIFLIVSLLSFLTPVLAPANAPWFELENRIEQLGIREKLIEAQIRPLILSRPHLNETNRPQVEKEIQARLKDLNDIRSELNRMRTILRYRFPERALQGAASDSTQAAREPLDLETFAARVTLEDRLEKTYLKVIEQYQRWPASSTDQNSTSGSSSARQPGSLDKLETPIISIGQ